jgi:uncharacterized alpha-E superfamily protein
MVKNTVISPGKANTLFWLGRYEERVYITLHQLRKCYDMMIDGNQDDYMPIWEKLDMTGTYQTRNEFALGMMYDENNPGSVISAQLRAMDNAILLRENIMSETLSYLEMSVALIRECSAKRESNVSCLQPIIDWSLAFWGSAEQRVQNHNALNLMMIGRNIENLDMLLRFDYPYERITLALDSLTRYCSQMPSIMDEEVEQRFNSLLTQEQYDFSDIGYKNELLKLINQWVKV